MRPLSIETVEDGDTWLVRLTHPPVNALDADLATALTDTFSRLSESDHRAVVLTGHCTSFSAGANLKTITTAQPEDLRNVVGAMENLFETVFQHPTPVVAAINGHAIAGGCVLALAADYRVMASGSGRIGLPELEVGLPLPPAAMEIVRFALGTTSIGRLLREAQTYTPEEALRLAIVDEVVGVRDVAKTARTVARELSGGRLAQRAYAITKQQLRRAASDAIANARDRHSRDVATCWCDPATQTWADAYAQRVTGQPR